MKRYIKVNGNWIDTLTEQREKYRTYIVIDEYVSLIDEEGNEDLIGQLEDETEDIMPLQRM